MDPASRVTGLFGELDSLYDNERLVSYSEGLAEFLVGGQRLRRVLPRAVLLGQIAKLPVISPRPPIGGARPPAGC